MKIYLEGGPKDGQEIPITHEVEQAIAFIGVQFISFLFAGEYKRTGRTRSGLRVYTYAS
jgi:hypothetical protein